jgi:DNA-binding response OmpR family regulator
MNTILLLLVEDESMILQHVEDALTDGGYEVITALDGAEAISRLNEQSGGFAGLITDIRLGSGMDGWEVARQAREMNASMAVVYMTGDSGGEWASKGVPKSLLVQKPFADVQLITAISTLLTEVASTPQKQA